MLDTYDSPTWHNEACRTIDLKHVERYHDCDAVRQNRRLRCGLGEVLMAHPFRTTEVLSGTNLIKIYPLNCRQRTPPDRFGQSYHSQPRLGHATLMLGAAHICWSSLGFGSRPTRTLHLIHNLLHCQLQLRDPLVAAYQLPSTNY